jgi:hypothetical protein
LVTNVPEVLFGKILTYFAKFIVVGHLKSFRF